AVTGSSGPGISLKIEALGLAVITELPVVLINVQRAGPATGIPTRSEQADLLQAMYGRHGEAPLCILAASSPDTAFYMAYEAARIATKFMTPVVLMTEGYINYTFGPWRLPDTSKLADFEFHFVQPEETKSYHPYRRNEIGSREWAIPGTQGLRHRVGGLERDLETGSVSNDGDNHEKMVRLREQKICNIVKDIPQLKVHGPKQGKLLVLGWGSTEGAIQEAVRNCNSRGETVSSAHLYYLNPFPENLGKVLDSFETILIPEINNGQLATLIRSRFLKKVIGLNRMNAEPIKVHEIESAIARCLLGEELTSERI
ncbi:MAG: 2-oxoglutarate ferredoxin oxidoreductase subunit alpha, partial [SAR324 cluster bacterium]|nr:2-oxoglutarate ferredoxin oxidoreductase subunit alpha [SAR324 cluster bacterium]